MQYQGISFSFRWLLYIISLIVLGGALLFFISIGSIRPGVFGLLIGGAILWLEHVTIKHQEAKFRRLVEALTGLQVDNCIDKVTHIVESVVYLLELVNKEKVKQRVAFTILLPLRRKHWRNDYDEICGSLTETWSALKVDYHFEEQALLLSRTHFLMIKLVVPMNDAEEVLGQTLAIIHQLIRKHRLDEIDSYIHFKDRESNTYIHLKGGLAKHRFVTEFGGISVQQVEPSEVFKDEFLWQGTWAERISEEQYLNVYNSFAKLPFVFDKVFRGYDESNLNPVIILSVENYQWHLVCTPTEVYFITSINDFKNTYPLRWDAGRVMEVRLASKHHPMLLCEDGSIIFHDANVEKYGEVLYYPVGISVDGKNYKWHKANFEAGKEINIELR